MLSLKDCLDFCDLDSSEVEAVAEHEHIPVILALELGNELLQTPQGVCSLHSMVLDNLNQALEAGDVEKANHFCATYQHLNATHPLPLHPQ